MLSRSVCIKSESVLSRPTDSHASEREPARMARVEERTVPFRFDVELVGIARMECVTVTAPSYPVDTELVFSSIIAKISFQ